MKELSAWRVFMSNTEPKMNQENHGSGIQRFAKASKLSIFAT